MQKCSSTWTTFSALMEFMFGRCSIVEVKLNAEIAQRIWFRRNVVINGGEFMHPGFVLKAFIDSIAAYWKVMEKDVEGGRVGIVSVVLEPIIWKPLLIGNYKVHWDAALDH